MHRLIQWKQINCGFVCYGNSKHLPTYPYEPGRGLRRGIHFLLERRIVYGLHILRWDITDYAIHPLGLHRRRQNIMDYVTLSQNLFLKNSNFPFVLRYVIQHMLRKQYIIQRHVVTFYLEKRKIVPFQINTLKARLR